MGYWIQKYIMPLKEIGLKNVEKSGFFFCTTAPVHQSLVILPHTSPTTTFHSLNAKRNLKLHHKQVLGNMVNIVSQMKTSFRNNFHTRSMQFS